MGNNLTHICTTYFEQYDRRGHDMKSIFIVHLWQPYSGKSFLWIRVSWIYRWSLR